MRQSMCVWLCWSIRYEGLEALGENAIVDVRWRAWRAWRASSTQSPIAERQPAQPGVQGSGSEPPSRFSPKRVQSSTDLRLGGSQMRWMHLEKGSPGKASENNIEPFGATCCIDIAVCSPPSCPRLLALRLHACCNPPVSFPFPGRSLNRTLRTSLPPVSTKHQTPPPSLTRLTRLLRLRHRLNRVGTGV